MKERTLFSFLLSLDSLLKSMSFFNVSKTSLSQPLHRTKIYILGNNDLLMNCWLSASSCILKTELERQAYIQTFYRLTFFFSCSVHLFENCLFAWICPAGKNFIPDSYFLLLLHIMNNSFIWWQMRCPKLQAFHKHIWIVQFPSHCIISTLALSLLIFR